MDGGFESFEVEEIRDKRLTKRGTTEYLIKWKGYPEHEKTWEPPENLQCYSMISEFEEAHSKKEIRRYKRPKNLEDKDGFDLKYTAKRIIGVSHDDDGRILFLVRWTTDKAEKDISFVYASRANDHVPSLVIDFYESKLTWHKQYRVSNKSS